MKNNKTLYNGPIFSLNQFEIEINNKTYKRDVLKHAPAVCIIVEKDNKFLLVKQLRYGIMEETLEVPAGLIDEAETPLDAANRELREETGLKAHNLELFYSLYPVPAYCDEIVHFFYATDFTIDPLEQDEDEKIELVWYTLDDILKELSKVNSSFDMKTIIAFQYYLLNIKK